MRIIYIDNPLRLNMADSDAHHSALELAEKIASYGRVYRIVKINWEVYNLK